MELLDLDNLCHSAHWEYEEGSKVNNDLIELSLKNKKKIQQVIDKMFENFDFLTLPSAQVFPFDIKKKFPDMINSYQLDTYHRWMEVSIIASLFELPVLSVPIGLNEFISVNSLIVIMSGIFFGLSLIFLVKAMDIEEISRVEPIYLIHTILVFYMKIQF